jgi:hypothetical protein
MEHHTHQEALVMVVRAVVAVMMHQLLELHRVLIRLLVVQAVRIVDILEEAVEVLQVQVWWELRVLVGMVDRDTP